MYQNVLYLKHVCTIGGVETFLYEIVKKYRDREIVVVYKTGDPAQIARLRRYAPVIHYNGGRILCRKAIFGYNSDIIDMVDADEYIQVIHADFDDPYLRTFIRPNVNPKFDRYVAVSENNAKNFEALTGIKCEIGYNPITKEKPRRVLHLITASRLSPEKGPWRIQKLAEALDRAGIRYQWQIFTDSKDQSSNPNIVYLPPRLDMTDFIADADFLVQLSDTEGYPYSILEALSYGTPVIVTPLPINDDIQIRDGENAIVLPFDMKEIPVERIAARLKRFKYTPRADRWGELLAEGPDGYSFDPDREVPTKSRILYQDIQLNRLVKEGEELHMKLWRALELQEKGFIDILEE